jgi:hypothetical protein
MRTALWTVFLVVALQGITSASTALASTDVNTPAPAVSTPDGPSTVAGPDADALKAQPSLRADDARKPVQSQPQVLSKNFQSPKPVQIYWFFGGR